MALLQQAIPQLLLLCAVIENSDELLEVLSIVFLYALNTQDNSIKILSGERLGNQELRITMLNLMHVAFSIMKDSRLAIDYLYTCLRKELDEIDGLLMYESIRTEVADRLTLDEAKCKDILRTEILTRSAQSIERVLVEELRK